MLGRQGNYSSQATAQQHSATVAGETSSQEKLCLSSQMGQLNSAALNGTRAAT